MEISKRSFIAGTLSSIALISGGLLGSRRKVNRMPATEAKARYGHLTGKQIEVARAMMESNDVTGSRELLLTEGQHIDLYMEEARLIVAELTAQPNSRLRSVTTMGATRVGDGSEVIKWQRLT